MVNTEHQTTDLGQLVRCVEKNTLGCVRYIGVKQAQEDLPQPALAV